MTNEQELRQIISVKPAAKIVYKGPQVSDLLTVILLGPSKF